VESLLEGALQSDRVDLLAWILDELKFPLEALNSAKRTPFLLAAYYGAPRCMALLLERGADVKAIDEDGADALWLLCTNSDVPSSAIVGLLKAGLALDGVVRFRTPLMNVCMKDGAGDAIQALVAAGARLDVVDDDNKDVLALTRCSFAFRRVLALFDDASLAKSAARNGEALLTAALVALPADVPLVETLLQRAPTLRTAFTKALLIDVIGSIADAAMMRFVLLKSDLSDDAIVAQALADAIRYNKKSNVQLLGESIGAARLEALFRRDVEHGFLIKAAGASVELFHAVTALDRSNAIDVNVVVDGETAFLVAAQGSDENIEILHALQARGANVHAVDNSGENALMKAVAQYSDTSPKVLEALLALGVKVDARDNDDRTALHLARNDAAIKFLLALGKFDVNARCAANQTPLIAIASRSPTAALLLLDAGADIAAVDNDGVSLLHEALRDFEGLPLLKRAGVEKAFVAKKDGATPLHTCTFAPALKALLACKFVKADDIDRADEDGMTPFLEAVRRADATSARLLRARGANVNAKNKKGRNAMHFVMEREDDALALELLAAGVSGTEVDEDGKAPLASLSFSDHSLRLFRLVKSDARLGGVAAIASLLDDDGTLLHRSFSNVALVGELVACGVDINARSKGYRPSEAIFSHVDSLAMLKTFRQHGAKMDVRNDYGDSVLLAACDERDVTFDTIVFLVEECGLSLGEVNDEKENVLHKLVDKEKSVPVLRALIAKFGAQLPPFDVPTKDGSTCLHLAAARGCDDVCEFLLGLEEASDAMLAARTDDGNSPLHVAVKGWRASLNVVKMLVARGNAADETNGEGETPLMLAANAPAVMSFLMALNPGAATAQLNSVDDEGRSALFRALENGSDVSQLDSIRAMGGSIDASVKANNGRTLLHAACASADLNAVRWMLAADASNVNASDDDGLTPVAVLFGRARADNVLPLLKAMVAAGASLTSVNSDEQTTAILAAEGRCLSLDVLALLKDNGVDLTARCKSGRNALYSAVRRDCNLDVVKALIASGCDAAIVDTSSQASLLHQACDDGEIEVARYALDELKLDPNGRDSDQRTPLHVMLSARLEPQQATELFDLLAPKSDLTARNSDGRSLAFAAAANRSCKVTPAIMQRLIDKLGTGNLETDTELLAAAIESANVGLVTLFLDRGAQVNASVKGRYYGENTPLILAADQYDVDDAVLLVALLLDRGANVNAATKEDHMTPLHKAKHTPVIELLVKRGADVGAKAKNGNFPLHCAADDLEIEPFAALLKHSVAKKIDLNALNKDGNSPLVIACESRDAAFEKVSALLDAGASPKIVDKRGALRTDFRTSVEIVQLLSERNPALKK
jgi:ankyrin repeat protein